MAVVQEELVVVKLSKLVKKIDPNVTLSENLFNETLEIRSDGTFIRDYVYVKDVADGYLTLMENMEKARGEAFNFSTGYNFSVLDLIKKISEILGKECRYTVANNQKNEIPVQSLNYNKAIAVLGWKSNYTIEDGIMETFKWYRNFYIDNDFVNR